MADERLVARPAFGAGVDVHDLPQPRHRMGVVALLARRAPIPWCLSNTSDSSGSLTTGVPIMPRPTGQQRQILFVQGVKTVTGYALADMGHPIDRFQTKYSMLCQ